MRSVSLKAHGLGHRSNLTFLATLICEVAVVERKVDENAFFQRMEIDLLPQNITMKCCRFSRRIVDRECSAKNSPSEHSLLTQRTYCADGASSLERRQ